MKVLVSRDFRTQARTVFQYILYSRPVSLVRPGLIRLLSRIHNHVFNLSTDPASNGEYWLISKTPNSGLYLDVGFHEGDWSERVLQTHPGVKVCAFDPMRASSSFAKRFDSSRLEFFDVALARISGEKEFYDYGVGSMMHSLVPRNLDLGDEAITETYRVKTATLDDWTEGRSEEFIEVLKIDAEGFDLDIMEGAERLLAQQKVGLIVFEYASGWFSSKRTLYEADRFLRSLNYRVFRLFPTFLVPYSYHVSHEGRLIGYFAALSERTAQSGRYPVRDIVLEG